ncbi:MAG: pheromone shutdown-related protein TraB [bacterium]|jgi:pheromone shutdown-related protein TraB
MKHEISLNGKRIILIGTAHISQASADEVAETIREVQPDTVAIELCATRYESLSQEDRWKNMDIVKVIKEGKAPLLMANLILSSFQKKMGDQMGVRPGAEMIKAIEIAEEINSEISLVDREVSITLKRAWRKLSLWQKVKLMSQLVVGTVDNPEISKEDIEKMKEEDMLTQLIEELSKEMPTIKEVLIDERDQYLATKIAESPGETIVAVVGAGHVPGILKLIDKPADLSKIEEIPPKSPLGAFLKWAIPLFIVGLIASGFFFIDFESGTEMIKRWFLANAILSAVGAALARGHILTILSAFIAAPFTSLNPMIAAGWVSGITEAWVRKPTVADFESLSTDVTTFRGFWRNEVTRILLVVVFSNLGSTVGTIIGGGAILPYFSKILKVLGIS